MFKTKQALKTLISKNISVLNCLNNLTACSNIRHTEIK